MPGFFTDPLFILLIGICIVVGGIIGALLAVPLAATVNAAVKYLAGRAAPGESDDHVEHALEQEEQARGVQQIPKVQAFSLPCKQ